MKKKEFKKASAVAAIVVTTIGMTGCTNSSTSKEKTEIKFSETAESKINKGMENQPESPYWFPKDLLEWDFEKDENAKYNVSVIPLAERVEKKKLVKSNATQNDEMKVVALSIMNSSTSGNAPRGINNFDANVFSYWQYIDQLVYWGGSSGEGIIVPPSADVIDASHKNGVPILGTIFFPQTAHGGKIEWLDTFLEKDSNGDFPIVDKLIEVSESFGFDGWFINQETDTKVTSFDDAANNEEKNEEETEGLTKQHADLMAELITKFKEKSENKLDIMWYDSMTNEGEMDWQNALTDKNKNYLVDTQMNPVSDSMFLNFWWNTDKLANEHLLEKSKQKAKEIGINPYDLYAGIDVQENGYSTPIKWELFADKNNKPYTSLGLYVPSWTYSSANDPDDFQVRENTFWVNAKEDPTKGIPVENGQWPGIATYSVEQTAITELPFVTNFNLGNGYNYFIEGQKVSNMDWNNRSMQDILPTYRWIFDQDKGNNLSITMDYADAYNGGNSLKFRGKMKKSKKSNIKLYSATITFDKSTTFTTTAKATAETELNLVLGFDDGSKEIYQADKKLKDEWTTVTYDVKKAVGKIVTSISYEMISNKSEDNYELHLGQLAVKPKEEKTSLKVKGLTVEEAIFDEEESNYAGIRLYWDKDKAKETKYYEIYRINEDDTRSFLGATPANTHYINALERHDKTNKTNLEVLPVDKFGVRGKPSESVTVTWPDNSVPKASFKASRTLAGPREKITFTNTSSTNTEKIKWEFEGADIQTSTDNEPVISYEKEGVYSVKLIAENKEGKTPVEIKGFITITNEAKGDLSLLSSDAKVEASSFTNEAEAPEFAIDGNLETKWCATGATPHTLTLDLKSVKIVSEIKMSHAEAGGESPDMNTKAYTIETSEDGKTYTKVARIINNESPVSIDTFAATKARYIRLSVDKPTQGSDSAVRIYEIEVYGLVK